MLRVINIMLPLVAMLSIAANGYSQITIDCSKQVGVIKKMNAVNNGPQVERKSQKKGNYAAYKDAAFPYARLHDAPICRDWAHTVDIDCIFPDFSADENNPESYDFDLTDKLLEEILSTGTKVFYRLGQSIENFSKKYEVFPPEDYMKWARICEHIISHYNDGWADGFHHGIEYWEIWNEPDLGFRAGRHLTNESPTWNGSDIDFFKFYETVSKYLKKRFPDLKFGGPALCEDNAWAERFLEYAADHGIHLDFFSYHLYSKSIEAFRQKNALMKSLLDSHGYGGVELILNEWNYLENWGDGFVYTLDFIKSYKSAAYTAAVMQACQDGPVDMLMYYDARPGTGFNGLFDFYSSAALPAYYAMYSWKKLTALGNQIMAASDAEDLYVTAAEGDDGRVYCLVTYYPEDKEKIEPVRVEIQILNKDITESVSFVTDCHKLHTETPIRFDENGKTSFFMEPCSYILFELK